MPAIWRQNTNDHRQGNRGHGPLLRANSPFALSAGYFPTFFFCLVYDGHAALCQSLYLLRLLPNEIPPATAVVFSLSPGGRGPG